MSLQRRRLLEGERRRMLERLLEDEQERRASLERQLSALQGGAPPSTQPQPVRLSLQTPSALAAAHEALVSRRRQAGMLGACAAE